MKLSIIIPAYNCEKTIAYCLDSILSQPEVFDYEVIVVDDGSTDGTATLVETIAGSGGCQPLSESGLATKLPVSTRIFQEKDFEYECRTRSRIRFLRQPQNAGVSAARNRGLDVALGEYIWFVDADDFIACNALVFVSEILGREKLDILQFQWQQLHSLPPAFSLPIVTTNLRVWNLANFDHLSDSLFIGPVWRAIFRKDAIGDIRFKVGLTHGEDSLFSQEVALTSQVTGLVDTCLYGYMPAPNSAMSDMSIRKFSALLALVMERIFSVEKSSRTDKEKTLLIRGFQRRLYAQIFCWFRYSEITREMWEAWFQAYSDIMIKTKWRPWWPRAISKILWSFHSPYVFIAVYEAMKMQGRFQTLFRLLTFSKAKTTRDSAES